jgi:hypothetical protein
MLTPLLAISQGLPEDWGDPVRLVLLGVAVTLALLVVWSFFHRRGAEHPLRRLLGRVATERTTVSFFLRGMFVPANEFFSRAPEYPPGPSGGVTVHKWTGIPEVFSAADTRATADVLRVLVAANPNVQIAFRSVEKDRKVWNEDAIAIGCHFTSQQILEGCEPRLVAFRNPDAFRSLVSQEVFEARGGTDYGLIYKGEHAASHRVFWVVMGLSDLATEAAAHFLRVNARALQRLTGARPFAAILAVPSARGREGAILRSLQPRPAWWRRLAYRKLMQRLAGELGAGAGAA